MNGYTTADEAAALFVNEIRGKTVLITGASPGGLGAEAGRVIAKYAALVILAGRNMQKLQEAQASIEAETPSANLRLLRLDLASFDSVREAAAEVNAYVEPIDVLINNAAVMMLPTYSTLPGTNIETQFGTNHVGPFLFTNLIKPRLAASTSPRVVNVSSAGHRFSPLLQDPTFGGGQTYTESKGYGQSKTANILFTIALAERWKDIGATSFSLHPGIIQTNLNRHIVGRPLMMLKTLGRLLSMLATKVVTGNLGGTPLALKTLEQGAATHIVAAFDPSIADRSGAYLCDCAIHNERAHAYALDQNEAKRLWQMSEDLLGENF